MQRRRIVFIAAIVAALTTALFLACFSHAAAWRVAAADRPWVERAVRGGAEAFGTSPEEYRAHTRPRVWRVAGQVCVALRSATHDDGGSYVACFAERDGRLVSERALGRGLGAGRLLDAVWAWVW
jgi:hypothetical protein